jgi:hypothetical protein
MLAGRVIRNLLLELEIDEGGSGEVNKDQACLRCL